MHIAVPRDTNVPFMNAYFANVATANIIEAIVLFKFVSRADIQYK